MWKAKYLAAKAALQALILEAKTKRAEVEAKAEAERTAEEIKAIDDLIAQAQAKRDEVVELETKAAAETALDNLDQEYNKPGEKPKAGGRVQGAPAVIPENHLGQSKGLSFANLWRATKAASGSGNREIFKQHAPEELEMSDRLKQAGYHPVYGDSVLIPLDADLLVEPEDEQHRKLADFTELRKEVKERLGMSVDQGSLARLIKRYPQMGEAFGLDRKAIMLLGDDTLGGYLIPSTQSGQIIDLFRAKSVLSNAGTTEIGLPPTGSLTYPRITSDPTFSYTDPDADTDASLTAPGTGSVRLLAKNLRGFVGIPNDLLRYSSPSAEMIVRAALAAKGAITSDNAGLEGAGSSIAPKGLITYTQSTAETPTAARLTLHVAQTVGADGNTLEPEDVALIQGLYWEGNDPDLPTAWIMRPMLWASICNKRADAVTAGDKKGPYLFPLDRGALGNAMPTSLGGVKVCQTTQASKNRSKGASSTLHYVVYGNFAQQIHGIMGVIEIATSEHVRFLRDQTIIRAIYRDDFAVAHEESFVFTDTLVQA